MSEQTQADNKNADDVNINNGTANESTPELKKHSFEAEVAQLLHLVTHSLYSNADIFVRELVSNASDACDKLRFEANNDDSLYEDDGELRIRIAVDEEAKTITFTDNGIGMAHETVVALFKIAHNATVKGTANEQGTGLGLLLCKEFIDMHGGVILVDSKPRKGSAFRCLFPMN